MSRVLYWRWLPSAWTAASGTASTQEPTWWLRKESAAQVTRRGGCITMQDYNGCKDNFPRKGNMMYNASKLWFTMCRSWEESGVVWLCMHAHVRQPEAAPKAGVTALRRTIYQWDALFAQEAPLQFFYRICRALKAVTWFGTSLRFEVSTLSHVGHREKI